ncbi:hypothetical protein [Streptacidiphilus albus]|nr:hypothetical protein [Streptacidiphilus albus]
MIDLARLWTDPESHVRADSAICIPRDLRPCIGGQDSIGRRG